MQAGDCKKEDSLSDRGCIPCGSRPLAAFHSKTASPILFLMETMFKTVKEGNRREVSLETHDGAPD